MESVFCVLLSERLPDDGTSMKRLIRRPSVAYLFTPAASRAPSCEWHRNNEVRSIYFSFTYNECRTQSTKDKNTHITLSQRYCFLSLCFHFVCPSRCPVVTMLTPRASRAHISRDGRRPARCPCRRIHLSFARYSELLVENREIFIPHLFSAPPQGPGGDSVWVSRRCWILIKLEWWGYHVVKKLGYYNMLSRFHSLPEREQRTDRQNCYINIARHCADVR